VTRARPRPVSPAVGFAGTPDPGGGVRGAAERGSRQGAGKVQAMSQRSQRSVTTRRTTTDQPERRLEQLHTDAVEQGPPDQSDISYWQRLCALRVLARLCWSTAELQECATRTLGAYAVPEMFVVVVDESLPACRRVAAAFLLDLIAPGWRQAVGGITIEFAHTVPGTPGSPGKTTSAGGRAVRTTPKRKAGCNARRAA
jgi:hypothetical protein